MVKTKLTGQHMTYNQKNHWCRPTEKAKAKINEKETVRLETGMMDQIMLVQGKGPVETWMVLRVWHTSQREEAERYLRDIKEIPC